MGGCSSKPKTTEFEGSPATRPPSIPQHLLLNVNNERMRRVSDSERRSLDSGIKCTSSVANGPALNIIAAHQVAKPTAEREVVVSRTHDQIKEPAGSLSSIKTVEYAISQNIESLSGENCCIQPVSGNGSSKVISVGSSVSDILLPSSPPPESVQCESICSNSRERTCNRSVKIEKSFNSVPDRNVKIEPSLDSLPDRSVHVEDRFNSSSETDVKIVDNFTPVTDKSLHAVPIHIIEKTIEKDASNRKPATGEACEPLVEQLNWERSNGYSSPLSHLSDDSSTLKVTGQTVEPDAEQIHIAGSAPEAHDSDNPPSSSSNEEAHNEKTLPVAASKPYNEEIQITTESNTDSSRHPANASEGEASSGKLPISQTNEPDAEQLHVTVSLHPSPNLYSEPSSVKEESLSNGKPAMQETDVTEQGEEELHKTDISIDTSKESQNTLTGCVQSQGLNDQTSTTNEKTLTEDTDKGVEQLTRQIHSESSQESRIQVDNAPISIQERSECNRKTLKVSDNESSSASEYVSNEKHLDEKTGVYHDASFASIVQEPRDEDNAAPSSASECVSNTKPINEETQECVEDLHGTIINTISLQQSINGDINAPASLSEEVPPPKSEETDELNSQEFAIIQRDSTAFSQQEIHPDEEKAELQVEGNIVPEREVTNVTHCDNCDVIDDVDSLKKQTEDARQNEEDIRTSVAARQNEEDIKTNVDARQNEEDMRTSVDGVDPLVLEEVSSTQSHGRCDADEIIQGAEKPSNSAEAEGASDSNEKPATDEEIEEKVRNTSNIDLFEKEMWVSESCSIDHATENGLHSSESLVSEDTSHTENGLGKSENLVSDEKYHTENGLQTYDYEVSEEKSQIEDNVFQTSQNLLSEENTHTENGLQTSENLVSEVNSHTENGLQTSENLVSEINSHTENGLQKNDKFVIEDVISQEQSELQSTENLVSEAVSMLVSEVISLTEGQLENTDNFISDRRSQTAMVLENSEQLVSEEKSHSESGLENTENLVIEDKSQKENALLEHTENLKISEESRLESGLENVLGHNDNLAPVEKFHTVCGLQNTENLVSEENSQTESGLQNNENLVSYEKSESKNYLENTESLVPEENSPTESTVLENVDNVPEQNKPAEESTDTAQSTSQTNSQIASITSEAKYKQSPKEMKFQQTFLQEATLREEPTEIPVSDMDEVLEKLASEFERQESLSRC